MERTNWSVEETEILRKLYPTATKEDLKLALPGRKVVAMTMRALSIGLKKRSRDNDLDKEIYKYSSYIDGKVFKTIGALYSYHKKHYKITNIETSLNTFYKNKPRPTCKCGCGGLTRMKHESFEFLDFCKGHYVRVPGNNPTRDNREIAMQVGKSTVATKNKRKAEGKVYTSWCKGMKNSGDPRLGKNKGKTLEEMCGEEKAKELKREMSDRMKQRYITDETLMPYLNIKREEFWAKEENKKAAGDRVSLRVMNGSFKTSKFELSVLNFLKDNNIDVIHQYRISDKEYNKVYDFKIIDKNILIEADGDFFHCNPEKFPDGPKYKTQFIHIANDKIKEKLAEDNYFILIRIWQNDFKKAPELLLEKINTAIKKDAA